MDNELHHYGIRGMRWGVRRFQNSDGTLTAAGKKRYNKELESYRADKKKLAEETRKFERVKKNKEKVEKLLADKQALIDQKRKLKAEKKAFKSGSKPDAKSDEPTPEQIEAKKKKVLDTLPLFTGKLFSSPLSSFYSSYTFTFSTHKISATAKSFGR